MEAEDALPLESENHFDPSVPCVLGIDEAGRGPVLGPMVYAAAYCALKDKDSIGKMGFMDSKVLTEAQRDVLFAKIRKSTALSFHVDVLHAEELSRKMLRINKVNLNTISHDSAIGLIRRALAKGVDLKEVYLDTVGPPEKYQAKLQHLFPDIKVTVSKKADSLFPIVSAASICAKVIRDHQLRKWKYKEPGLNMSTKFGSGYPGDPTTKAWLKGLDPVFGFPSVLRFSWKTCDVLLKKSAVDVKWSLYGEDDDEIAEVGYDRRPTKTKDKAERFRYFAENGMELVTAADF